MKDILGRPIGRMILNYGRSPAGEPGHNTPALKQTFVRRARFGQDTCIVGSGIYTEA
jgi:hypothetical protein